MGVGSYASYEDRLSQAEAWGEKTEKKPFGFSRVLQESTDEP